MNGYFQPDVVVVCAGADGLSSDPFNKFALSINGICKAVSVILSALDLPTIILGGGGYNAIDTAKCWTKIVSIAANIRLSNDIPFHANFDQYAPHYLLDQMITNKPQPMTSQKSKRLYIYAMQSVYAHLNNFERLFIANLKQKCRQKEVALKEIEVNKKLNEESKEMEHVKDENVAEEEEEYEEECEDDADIEDKN